MNLFQYMLLGVAAAAAAFVFIFVPLVLIYGITDTLGGGLIAAVIAIVLVYLIYWRWLK